MFFELPITCFLIRSAKLIPSDDFTVYNKRYFVSSKLTKYICQPAMDQVVHQFVRKGVARGQ